jgi:hypothetical protein
MANNNQDNGDREIPALFSQKPETAIANVQAIYDRFKDDPQLLRSMLGKAGVSPEILSRLPQDLQRKIGAADRSGQSDLREHIERQPGRMERAKEWLRTHVPHRNRGQGPPKVGR